MKTKDTTVYINQKGLYSIKLNGKRLSSILTYPDLITLQSLLNRIISAPNINKFKAHLQVVISEVSNIPINTILEKNSKKDDIVTARHFIHYYEYLFNNKAKNSLITMCSKGAVINSVDRIKTILEYKHPAKYYSWYLEINNKLNEQFSNNS